MKTVNRGRVSSPNPASTADPGMVAPGTPVPSPAEAGTAAVDERVEGALPGDAGAATAVGAEGVPVIGRDAGVKDSAVLLWPVLKRLPTYVRLAWALCRDPAIPRRHKAALYTAIAYVTTPIHAPLSIIPVLGQVDSPLALLMGIRSTLRHAPPDRIAYHLDRLGLEPDQVNRDLALTGEVGHHWLRRAARGIGGGLGRAENLVSRPFQRRKRGGPGG